MEHLSDIELIEYVAGRLPATKSKQARQHIAQCNECSSRWKDTLEVWNTLGQWHIDTSAHQVADRVLVSAAKIERDRRQRRTAFIPLRKSVVAALRIAAAIIITISGGYLLGKYSVRRNALEVSAADGEPRYIAALGFEWSSELTWAVLEEDTPDGAYQR